MRIDNALFLRIARNIQFVLAGAALLAAGVAIAATLFHQANALNTTYDTEAVPPPYETKGISLNADIVRRRLRPPSSVSFIPTRNPVSGTVEEGDFLGAFAMETANKPASFPDDIRIIGGKDGNSFERREYPSSGQTGLTYTAELAEEINAAIAAGTDPYRRSFEITVLAYDEYKNRSAPTEVRFSTSFTASATPQRVVTNNQGSLASPLWSLAYKLAVAVDAEGTRNRIDLLEQIEEQLKGCKVNDRQKYLDKTEETFEVEKASVTADNVGAFLAGVCEAWKTALKSEEAKRRARQSEINGAEARNARNAREMQSRVAAAKLKRNASAVFIASSLFAFVVIVLVLAFLALENHSRSIRMAVVSMAKSESKDRDHTFDDANDGGENAS